jgi:hypothetical protein
VVEASVRPLYNGERTLLQIVEQLLPLDFELTHFVGALHSEATGAIVQVDALFERVRRGGEGLAPGIT